MPAISAFAARYLHVHVLGITLHVTNCYHAVSRVKATLMGYESLALQG
jgi:hypothetical protein